jgi:hypothetical protein
MDWGAILNNALSILAAIATISGLTGVSIIAALRARRKQQPPQQTQIPVPQMNSSQAPPLSLTRREWTDVLYVALINTIISKEGIEQHFPFAPMLWYTLAGFAVIAAIYMVLFLLNMTSLISNPLYFKIWLVSAFLAAFWRFMTVMVDYKEALLEEKQEQRKQEQKHQISHARHVFSDFEGIS